MKYEQDSIDETVVTLDTYNSDLNLVIDGSKYSANPLTKEGFAFMWAGARATHGADKGKFCFEVKVIDHQDVSHLPADEPNPHVVRVGFSVDSTSMQLGEDPLSYGYGGTGKISTNCRFQDFGPPFIAGDCVLALADMSSDPVQIGFAKNGKFIGWAYKVRKSELQSKALFPHVLSKNCSFEVNFGQRPEPYFKLPDNVKEFTFIGCLPLEQRIGGTRPPEKREDCEMIMMCGLPGAGKSVWAADYSAKHPEKKYNVLGTNNIIDKMKVMGLPRKRNYAGRWDVLIQMATKCLNSMFAIGSKLRRNYILDQTNVYPTAQRRKMRNFDGFKRKAVVVVPSEAEYKKRCDKRDREEGKEVPESAVLEMKANFALPEVNDIFDEVTFTELQREEAAKLVKKYNEEGKAFLGPAKKQFRPNEPDNKGFDNRNKGNFGYNRNDSPGGWQGDMRGGNFPDQGMRGPGDRGDYGGGRGGFNSGRGGYDGGFRGRDYSSDRGGFGERRDFSPSGYGGYDSNRGGGRDSFENSYGGRGGGYDSPYGGGRGGFDGGQGDGRGSYDSPRDGGRGSYDGGRGGGRGGYDSGRGGRGGYDNNRGGRGGYDGSRGGGRGGYDGSSGGGRGGYDSSSGGGRGGYDSSSGGGRGGYDSSSGGGRGGYDSSSGGGRGGYDGGRGGGRGSFDNSRGGGRGGFDSSRGGGRGGFDSRGGGRGGFDSRGGGRGGYDSSRGSGRGGYDSSRGGGRGGYDSTRGGGRGGDSSRGGRDSSRDGRDSYRGSRDYDERKDTYGRDSTSGGYGGDRGYERASRFDQPGDTYKSDYGANESVPAASRQSGYGYSGYGSGSYSDQYSDQSYGSSPRGSSTTSYQQGSRGGAGRGGSRGGYQGDSYSRETDYSSGYNSGSSSSNVQSAYGKDYGYGSSTYGDYKSTSSADSYPSTQSYSGSATAKNNTAQRYSAAGGDTSTASSKYSQGTGYSAAPTRTTRWSAVETTQPAAAVPAAAAPAPAPADTYSTGIAQSYGYSATDQSATSYQGYQTGATASTAASQWMGASSVPAAGYGAAQSQWYGQQVPGQYYSQ